MINFARECFQALDRPQRRLLGLQLICLIWTPSWVNDANFMYIRLMIELRATHCDGDSNQFNHVYIFCVSMSILVSRAAQERARPTFSFFPLQFVVWTLPLYTAAYYGVAHCHNYFIRRESILLQRRLVTLLNYYQTHIADDVSTYSFART